VAATLVLVAMHWLMAVIAFHSERFEKLVQGRTEVIIRNGKVQWETRRRKNISEDDLREALRSNAMVEEPSQVESARPERDGKISIIPRSKEPRVIEVEAGEGVQTIRIEVR
jgi:uncharacterized membrane protein YcaP (DUF421 family)